MNKWAMGSFHFIVEGRASVGDRVGAVYTRINLSIIYMLHMLSI
jgi:hypothetical protein